jgi:hypothetical protein
MPQMRTCHLVINDLSLSNFLKHKPVCCVRFECQMRKPPERHVCVVGVVTTLLGP